MRPHGPVVSSKEQTGQWLLAGVEHNLRLYSNDCRAGSTCLGSNEVCWYCSTTSRNIMDCQIAIAPLTFFGVNKNFMSCRHVLRVEEV